ncbi:pseudouridine-5'-phosphate glycosidase [Pelagophyceae sp. CCMP2097]|nr:pseudouridine-5'-phosphate glycosidase [Pelagophyceae sp. CCMP2097]
MALRRLSLGASGLLQVSDRVSAALRNGGAVVALESTIITHGLPYPTNLDAARAVESAVEAHGATPATIAILDGKVRVGLSDSDLERLAVAGRDGSALKCSRRDIAYAAANGAVGGTTVAGTSVIADLAGIRVFATGGIGGVHRGGEGSMDVSADLVELGRTPIVVVCAGVKSILDIGRTLEVLETHGVAVFGYGTWDFPAFYCTTATDNLGLAYQAPMRSDTPGEVAAWLRANEALGLRSGAVVAVPNPRPLDSAFVDKAVHVALLEAKLRCIVGRDATPFLLKRVKELTGGQSLESNVALVEHNAGIAAQIAVAAAQ